MDRRILLVDDDTRLQALLTEYFVGNGFEVICLNEGTAICSAIKRAVPDIIILDVMLPGKDGLEVLRDIRKEHRLPVIMLTAKGEETDRIVGLELGADDYVPKPFNPRELLARIKAVLRRIQPLEDTAATRERPMIRSGEMVLNRSGRTLEIDGESVVLSTTEFDTLEVLMMRPDIVLTRDQLMTLARGRDYMAFDRSVDVHISKLRAKLNEYPSGRNRIKTIWGTGYMFIGHK